MSERIRDWVEENPGKHTGDIAAGLGVETIQVSMIVHNMATRGMLLREGKKPCMTFTIGRAPRAIRTPDKDLAVARRKASRKALNKLANAARKEARAAIAKPKAMRPMTVKPQVIRCDKPVESVEEFMARGGSIRRLPTNWAGPCNGAMGPWQ